eukprot:scaffold24817_cov211-Cylindrotheca_fusiformis.AAC.2
MSRFISLPSRSVLGSIRGRLAGGGSMMGVGRKVAGCGLTRCKDVWVGDAYVGSALPTCHSTILWCSSHQASRATVSGSLRGRWSAFAPQMVLHTALTW